MSRKEYMEQLDMLLRDIPHTERREALKYYEEYFEDAGKEHEAEIIEELGSPEELAKKLREDLKREEGEAVRKTGGNQTAEKDRTGEEQNQKENGPAGGQGETVYTPKKSKSGYKAAIVCFIILGILIGIGRLGRLVWNAVWFVADVSGGETIEKLTENYEVYGEDGIRDLDIEAGIGDLVIESWNQEEISISYPKAYMKVKKEGNELSLETRKRWFVSLRNWFGIWDDEKEKAYQIQIKIPKDYVFRDAEVATGVGTANIERLEAISIFLKTGAGELEAGELAAAEEISIEAGVGETVIHNLQATEAEFSVGVGELNVKGRVDGDISADCGVGELVIELSNEESAFNYDVSCGVGDVSINGKSYSGIGSSHSDDNGAAYDFDISCGVGSIEVLFTGGPDKIYKEEYMEMYN